MSTACRQVAAAALVCAAGLGFICFFHQSVGVHHPLVKAQDVVRVTDGVYYLAVVDAFWSGDAQNMYELETQIAVVKKLTDVPVEAAMPLNPLPPLFAVLLPFTAFASGDIRLAYSSWMGVSLFFLLCSIIWFSHTAGILRVRSFLPGMLLLLICLVSYSTQVAVVLGQTAVLHTACLLLLVIGKPKHGSEAAVVLRDGLCIFLLSVKPQFFLLGLGLCFIGGRYRGALYGIGAAAAVTAVLTPQLGYDWPLQYFNTLKYYQGAQIDAEYRGAFAPELMNVFVTAFADWLGKSTSSLLTWSLLGAGFIGALILSRIGAEERRYQVPAAVLLLSSYLLFAPHSGFYEEMLWIALSAVVIGCAVIRREMMLQLLAASAGIGLLVNRLAVVDCLSSPFFWWTIKLFVCALLSAASYSAASKASDELQLTDSR